jgi:hypothetical protein
LIADGVSYASTGRSMTDHAISTVAEEDCKLFRAVDGEPVCREAANGMPSMAEVSTVEINGRQIAVSYDYPSSDPSPTAIQSDPVAATPGLAIASVAPAGGVAAGSTATTATTRPADQSEPQPVPMPARAAGRLARAPVPNAKPRQVVQTQIVQAQVVQAQVVKAGGVAVAMAERARVEKPQLALFQAAKPRIEKAAARPADDGSTVVVVQSHWDRARAEQVARSHRALGAKVARAQADGRTVYRVVVAVAPADSPTAAKARLARAGFKDAWLASL